MRLIIFSIYLLLTIPAVLSAEQLDEGLWLAISYRNALIPLVTYKNGQWANKNERVGYIYRENGSVSSEKPKVPKYAVPKKWFCYFKDNPVTICNVLGTDLFNEGSDYSVGLHTDLKQTEEYKKRTDTIVAFSQEVKVFYEILVAAEEKEKITKIILAKFHTLEEQKSIEYQYEFKTPLKIRRKIPGKIQVYKVILKNNECIYRFDALKTYRYKNPPEVDTRIFGWILKNHTNQQFISEQMVTIDTYGGLGGGYVAVEAYFIIDDKTFCLANERGGENNEYVILEITSKKVTPLLRTGGGGV